MNRELLAYAAAGAVGRARNALGQIEGGRRRKHHTRRHKTKRTRKH
jgi:hypothetical protein